MRKNKVLIAGWPRGGTSYMAGVLNSVLGGVRVTHEGIFCTHGRAEAYSWSNTDIEVTGWAQAENLRCLPDNVALIILDRPPLHQIRSMSSLYRRGKLLDTIDNCYTTEADPVKRAVDAWTWRARNYIEQLGYGSTFQLSVTSPLAVEVIVKLCMIITNARSLVTATALDEIIMNHYRNETKPTDLDPPIEQSQVGEGRWNMMRIRASALGFDLKPWIGIGE